MQTYMIKTFHFCLFLTIGTPFKSSFASFKSVGAFFDGMKMSQSKNC